MVKQDGFLNLLLRVMSYKMLLINIKQIIMKIINVVNSHNYRIQLLLLMIGYYQNLIHGNLRLLMFYLQQIELHKNQQFHHNIIKYLQLLFHMLYNLTKYMQLVLHKNQENGIQIKPLNYFTLVTVNFVHNQL